ncbi:ROK family transcriptional regulator [Thermosediminibacter litoriperuensis]|uniref:Glucokinase-like ROK family protein n=1 Tax=Thermosediminibacter litoriperuensis TaxID=291989 RepID=A0A5S5APJ6_9FIRM|nr:ROK family transcriptional regulator [Thermosediminibacter litoriperuensis]TYP53240.1 glucokinase-like ROK family protein [Thermosediminibacter litoriperuensis]
MSKGPGNSKYVKKINRMTVLNLIKQHEVISRQELAKITGLTPPAITGIIRELLEIGLVKEVGLAKSRGGRRPVKLKFNPEAGYVIGIEVTRFETSIGIADLKNDPTEINTIDLDMTDPDAGISLLADTIKHILDQGVKEGKNFLGVGVAFPGLLNVKEGIVKRSINLGPKWKGYPVKEAIEKQVGLPVFVENNSNASALAERWFGGAVAYKDLVYVNFGEGISAGIIMDDRILQGFQGHAGEIGHIVMVEDGPLCNCGNRGCLESICGIPALLRKVNSELLLIKDGDPLKKIWKIKGKVGADDIIKCASKEGSYAYELLKQMARYVGLAIADVVNLYNPEAVFIGGKMAKAAEIFMDVINKTVHTHAFPEIAMSTSIKVSSLGKNSGVIGACALALRELFKSSSDIVDYIQSNTSKQEKGGN